VLIMLGIVLVISSWAFTIGLALAVWTVVMWLGIPAAKFMHWLLASSALHRRRARALAVTAALAAIIIGGIGAWPAPDHRRTVGVIEAAERAELMIRAPGFVNEVHATAGDWVEAGDLILAVDNPALRAEQ